MVQRISRFHVGPTAKVLAVFYGLMGLLLTPFFVLAAMLAPDAAGFGVGFALLLPILYAVIGFISTAIGCVMYNFAARMTGGIEFQLGPGRV